jgi:hypothetical protein
MSAQAVSYIKETGFERTNLHAHLGKSRAKGLLYQFSPTFPVLMLGKRCERGRAYAQCYTIGEEVFMVSQRASQNLHTGEHFQPVGRLLESQEQAILEEISGLEMPHSQRASVLLALDSGASQKEAGERAGLSPRQARYWRDRFVQHRLDIFPKDLLAQIRVGPILEEGELINEQENEVISTTQEETEKMTGEPRESDKQVDELQETAAYVEEQEEAKVDKKSKKDKSKKEKQKSKKDKKRKKKKPTKKASAKKKSAKSKKKRRKK